MKRAVWLLLFLNVMVFAYVRLTTPVTAPAADAGASAPTLTLVSELPSRPAPRCLRIGPWKDPATAEALKSWFEQAHYSFHEHLIESTAPASFAVTLVSVSADAAAKVARLLKSAGITDFEVLSPQASAVETTIALGHYSDRKSAEQRVDRLKALGLHPQIVTPPLTAAGGWFEVLIDAAAKDPEIGDIVHEVPGADGMTVVACPVEAPITPPGVSPAPTETPSGNSPNGTRQSPAESAPPGRAPVTLSGAPA